MILTGVVTGALAWLYGGTIGDVNLKTVPWLTVLLLEGLLCFPQQREGESPYLARERVWESLRRDPLTWLIVGFLLYLCLPFVNEALCPICDAAAIAEGKDPGPLIPFLPFCVNRLHHLNVVLWFLPALTVALTVRHALTKTGKRHLVEFLVWNGALLGVWGFIQQVAGAPGPLWAEPEGGRAGYFFSTFGYPNMAGDYFAMIFCLSLAMWMWRSSAVSATFEFPEDVCKVSPYRLFWRKHYLLIPALVSFYAALNTLSRAGILLVSVSAGILFLHAGVLALSRMKKAARVRAGAFGALALLLMAVAASVFMPEEIKKEVDTLATQEVLDRVTGRQEWHARVSIELFKDHPLYGCGGWGYQHFSPTKLLDKDGNPRRAWGAGSANVHNDYLQFLAEHGAIGFGLLVVITSLFLLPTVRVWRRLAKSARFMRASRHLPAPQSLFALPGSAFAMLTAAAVPLVHAFGDCPLRSPAVLTLFFVSLAAAVGFLPRGASGSGDANGDESREEESTEEK
jgi:hypothetical protein